MNLREYVTAMTSSFLQAAQPADGFFSSPAYGRLFDVIGNEGLTESYLNQLFWQIVATPPGLELLLRPHLAPFDLKSKKFGSFRIESLLLGAQLLVVRHGGIKDVTLQPLSTLMILSDGIIDPRSIPLNIDFEVAQALFANWQRSYLRSTREDPAFNTMAGRLDTSNLMGLLDGIGGPRFLVEASKTQPFDILLAPRPAVIRTSAPSPHWEVATCCSVGPECTLGAFAHTNCGRRGFTTCLHGVEGCSHTPVRVTASRSGANVHGNVIASDQVSDSCFVETNVDPPPGCALGKPLAGLAPRQNERVWFDGMTSGKVSTVIMANDLGLPNFTRRSQAKIYTAAVTASGDSGAALVDSSGKLLGFAFERTGLEESIEYSSWIWAHSVYSALDLVI